MTDAHLLVFAKAPQPGCVKTRLVPPLTPEGAAAVYEAALRDVIAGALGSGARVRILFDDTPGAEAYFARAFPELERRPQCAGDLGRRLCAALATRFAEGAESVAVIGADSPTLPGAYLSEGLAALREADGVLGPADDGGYYLIGVRRDAWPEAATLFREVPWSTDRVVQITLQRAAEIGLELRVLARWYDIDRAEDLARARTDARADSHLARLLAADGSVTRLDDRARPDVLVAG
jgi:uncharacterized protein